MWCPAQGSNFAHQGPGILVLSMRIFPSGPLTGSLTLPGDKSISHRYAILASLAEGNSVIHNYSTGADCHSTLACLRSLGIAISEDGLNVTIEGRGLQCLARARNRSGLRQLRLRHAHACRRAGRPAVSKPLDGR